MRLDEIVVSRSRWQLASLRIDLKRLRFGLVLRAYNPNQPRVPAGQPDAGQWTSEGESGAGQRIGGGQVILISADNDPRYPVLLEEE